jgi:hypothetical protein
VRGSGDDAATDVLVLDNRDYLCQPDPDRAGPDGPTALEVEDRFRRAVIDYLSDLLHRGQM